MRLTLISLGILYIIWSTVWLEERRLDRMHEICVEVCR